MLVSRHSVTLKNAEVKCALPLGIPSEELYKSFPHSTSYDLLCEHVFGRLIVLIRLHQYFSKGSNNDVLNPAQLLGNNFLDRPPELPVIILNILGAATADFSEPRECPILYHDVKPEWVDLQLATVSFPPIAQEPRIKPAIPDDELVINVHKRRKSNSGRSIVPSTSTNLTSSKSKQALTLDDKEILAMEAMSCGLLKTGFSNRESKLKWLSIQETRLFALKLGLWWIQTSVTAKSCQELITFLKVPYKVIISSDQNASIEVGLQRETADFIRSRNWPIENGVLSLPLWTLYHLLILRFYHHEIVVTDAVVDIMKPLRVAQLDSFLVDTFRKLENYNPEMASYVNRENTNFAKLSLSALGDSFKRFPPCMNLALVTEKTKKHLKYGARMQLWPFLKDCGLPIDQQVALHKQLWGDAKQIDQELGYTLRHVYGLEGKKTAKSCYSCDYVINSRPPSLAEGFGCPFYEAGKKPAVNGNYLRQLLGGYGVPDIEGIVKTNELEGPPIACRALFRSLFGEEKDQENVGINPASFYKDSF